ncbi:MAG: UDP-N-acetylglucosamine 1-carboxyvinyltransferase [Alphaproteobacteria bacterium]|nr:UDP-N-acetylglucosamine 1-carboxyvinyltransferase [Alphaproteobacteria bacterium]
MDRLRIAGGKRLVGEIPIGGAKNAALPLMAASLLTDQELTLRHVPRLADIDTMTNLLVQHGVTITLVGANGKNGNGHAKGDERRANGGGVTMRLKADDVGSTTAPYDLVRKMRASVLVLGPLVARHGQARVSLPGGCAIGTRPIDLHLKGLQELGAEVVLEGGYVTARAPHGLTGARIVFPQVSVGATENLLMAASLARGETVLVNAAREPEVADLARCLVAMGAEIEGIGTDQIVVRGVDRLHAAEHQIVPDRIEAGTFAIAAAITGGDIELLGMDLALMEAPAKTLGEAGVAMSGTERGIRVAAGNRRPAGVDVMTEPFPGFPTDLQAQMMALMTVSEGAAMITETIFENRFMHVPELCRMGANINVHGSSAMVRGVASLTGAPVMATDLRASVSLVLAGLAARGETTVNRIYHLDRGYERVEEKLAACGADIERVRD